VSGYGTLRSRVGNTVAFRDCQWKSKDRPGNEIKCYKDFVNLLTRKGEDITKLKTKEDRDQNVWNHVLSQMWFIDMYPCKIDFVLQREDLSQQFMALKQHLNIKGTKYDATKVVNFNESPYNWSKQYRVKKRLLEEKNSSEKLRFHYRQDFACFAYNAT